jgi:hypothetical protein
MLARATLAHTARAGAEFNSIENKLWNKACMEALNINDPFRKEWSRLEKTGIVEP